MTVKRRTLEGGKREEQKCHEPRAMLSCVQAAGERFVAAVKTGPA
jgi:hypothetical protein